MFTGILGGIAAKFGGEIVSSIFGTAERSLQAYFNKEISKEQLMVQLQTALAQAFVELERAQADALKSMFASFMGALVQSKVVQYVWATVVLVELTVMVLYQTSMVPAVRNIEWTLILIGGLCGIGPLVVPSKVADLKSILAGAGKKS